MSKNRVLPEWINFIHPVSRPKNVVSAVEVDLGLFDWLVDKPEVSFLIRDLGLVPGSPDAWFRVACKTPLFCEIVKAYHASLLDESRRLCYELYLRNRKYSRYVHRSYFR